MQLERRYAVKLNAFEVGVLQAFLWKHKDCLNATVFKNVMEQLIRCERAMKEEAGVKVQKLPDGQLKFTDVDGNTVIRKPYEWENY